jgi:hypothetical protein
MRTHHILAAALASVVLASVAFTQSTLATVRIGEAVLADGQRMAPGTYQVRLTDEDVEPLVGQSPNAERWVEFLKGGQVVGRELATVVGREQIGAIAKSTPPGPDSARVDVLKGGDYVRVWIAHGGTNYIINMPVAPAEKGRPGGPLE